MTQTPLRRLSLTARMMLMSAVLVLVSPPAHAADAATREAHQRFEAGAKLYRQARYQDAIAEFQKAYAARANANILFNIAQSYEKLGDLERALEHYRRYLEDVHNADDHDTIQTVVANLEARIAKARRGHVSVQSAPAGASVSLDGKDRGLTPVALELDPGTYALRAAKPGFEPTERTLKVEAGNTLQLELSLVEAMKPLPWVVVQDKGPQVKPARRRVWTWIAYGAGAATLLGAAAVGLGAAGTSNKIRQADGTQTTQEVNGLRDSAQGQAKGANVLYGVTGVLAATGTVLFFVEGRF